MTKQQQQAPAQAQRSQFRETLEAMLEDGEPVELSKNKRAIVLPMGVVHVKRCQASFVRMMSELVRIDPRLFAKGLQSDDVLGEIVQRLLPIAVTDLLDLVESCVLVEDANGNERRFDALPHWDLAPIVEKWIALSFDPARLDPWKLAIQGAVRQLTGKTLPISDLFSKASSLLGTPSAASSTSVSQAGHTEGGASGS